MNGIYEAGKAAANDDDIWSLIIQSRDCNFQINGSYKDNDSLSTQVCCKELLHPGSQLLIFF